jgi:hypothetical protein
VVAAIGDTPEQTVFRAFLADLAVAEKSAYWAEKPEIMQSLYDGNLFLCTCPID